MIYSVILFWLLSAFTAHAQDDHEAASRFEVREATNTTLIERANYDWCDAQHIYYCIDSLCCPGTRGISCMPANAQCCTTGQYCAPGYDCVLRSDGLQTCKCASSSCSGNTSPLDGSRATTSAGAQPTATNTGSSPTVTKVIGAAGRIYNKGIVAAGVPVLAAIAACL